MEKKYLVPLFFQDYGRLTYHKTICVNGIDCKFRNFEEFEFFGCQIEGEWRITEAESGFALRKGASIEEAYFNSKLLLSKKTKEDLIKAIQRAKEKIPPNILIDEPS